MEVNDELAVLRRAIPAAIDAIAVGGRVVVESYHSLEDRIVKRAFAEATRSTVPEDLPFVPEGSAPALRLVTRGAEQADESEIAAEPTGRLGAAPRRRTRQSPIFPGEQLHEQHRRRIGPRAEPGRPSRPPSSGPGSPSSRTAGGSGRRGCPFVTLVSLVLLGGIVGLLCFNTQMQQASFAASTLEERAANLSAREQTLHSELQALRDPQHVALLAAQAGMVAPLDACTLRLGGAAAEATCTPGGSAATPPTRCSPAPPKPAVIDPAPQIVMVAAPADAKPREAQEPEPEPAGPRHGPRLTRIGAGDGDDDSPTRPPTPPHDPRTRTDSAATTEHPRGPRSPGSGSGSS